MCSKAKRLKTDGTCGKSWRVTPILSDEVFADVPLVKAMVVKIENKRHLSGIISQLNKIFPVPSLQHLKRVRGDEILIDLAGLDDQTQSLKEKLGGHESFTRGLTLDPYVSLVPATQPRTKAQFKSCNRIWPCNFHPDKSLEDTISGEQFNQAALDTIETWMRASLALCGHSGIGCLVVDPETNQQIASGVDNRLLHPMKHAAMVAIDNVAKAQESGAWNEESEAAVDSAMEKLLQEESVPSRSKKNDRLMKESEEDKATNQVLNKSIKEDDLLKNKTNIEAGRPTGPYLCTGYDVYLTAEPCLMCAMALVHSRVKRIFYGCPNRATGALGSRLKLHTVPNLNHHYEVYAGVLASECEQALNKGIPGVLKKL